MKQKIKNKKIVLIIAICIIIFLIFFIKIIFDNVNDTEAIYGNRLDGIEKVEVEKSTQSSIIKNIEETEKTKKVAIDIQGKIINVSITLKEDTSRDDAKQLGDKVLEKLSDKQKEFYDVQVFIKKETEDASFPMIGYRHHKKTTFTWTRDR